MGIPIKPPVLHEETARTEYRANGAPAVILDLISMLSVALLPLLVGFSLGQFWITFDSFASPPTAHYTRKAMARAVATDGTEYLWSTSQRLEELLESDPRAMRPFVTHSADDKNRDGRPDVHRFSFVIPLRTDAPISTFEFLPVFDYSIDNDLIYVSMESAPMISLTASASASPTSYIVAEGKMRFSQTLALSASPFSRYDVVYRRSYLDDVRDVSDLRNIAEIGRRYNARNETTPILETVVSTTNDASLHGPSMYHSEGQLPNNFGVDITIRVPLARVDYSPSFGEALKHGWVQYFCIAYVFYWAFGHIKRIAISRAFVNTIAEVRGRP